MITPTRPGVAPFTAAVAPGRRCPAAAAPPATATDRAVPGRGPQAVREALAAGAVRRAVRAPPTALARHARRWPRGRRAGVGRSPTTALAALDRDGHAAGPGRRLPAASTCRWPPRWPGAAAGRGARRDPRPGQRRHRAAHRRRGRAPARSSSPATPSTRTTASACGPRAGSLFHVDVVRGGDPADAWSRRCARPGCRCSPPTRLRRRPTWTTLADAGALAAPTAWLFGSEAHGLPDELLAAADARVRVPIHGRAESLNLAAAAAVCLYASARAQR